MSNKELNLLTSKLANASVDVCKTVSFEYRGLKLDDKESAEEIVNAIEGCPDMEVLELKGNTLGVKASEVIGKSLEKRPSFKKALWSDLFTGRLKSEIPEALKNLCNGIMVSSANLVELDLSDNAFGPNGMLGLTEFLKSSSCYSLQNLKLNNNGLGITGGRMLADSLKICYRSSEAEGHPLALKVFVSGRGRLEDEGATALAEAFKLMRSLEVVDMPQNGINHRGITELSSALAVNTNLRILNLSDNTFTEKGSLSMAKALECLDNLEEINFEDCLVRTDGAISIAAAIQKGHNKLKVLRLSGNEIHLTGAEEIIKAIANKPQIGVLDMNANQFGESGVELIRKELKKVDKLSILCDMSDDEGSENTEDSSGENSEASHQTDVSVEEWKKDDWQNVDELNNDDSLVVNGNGVNGSSGVNGCNGGNGLNGETNEFVNGVCNVVDDSSVVYIDDLNNSVFNVGNSVCNGAVNGGKKEKDLQFVKDFIRKPAASKLEEIFSTYSSFLIDTLLDELRNLDETLMNYVKILVEVFDENMENYKLLIVNFSDKFLDELFKFAEQDGISEITVCNSFLVALGLIKGEDKKLKGPSSIKHVLTVLSTCLVKPYVPSTFAQIFLLFIKKDSPMFKDCPKQRQLIIQSMNSRSSM